MEIREIERQIVSSRGRKDRQRVRGRDMRGIGKQKSIYLRERQKEKEKEQGANEETKREGEERCGHARHCV